MKEKGGEGGEEREKRRRKAVSSFPFISPHWYILFLSTVALFSLKTCNFILSLGRLVGERERPRRRCKNTRETPTDVDASPSRNSRTLDESLLTFATTLSELRNSPLKISFFAHCSVIHRHRYGERYTRYSYIRALIKFNSTATWFSFSSQWIIHGLHHCMHYFNPEKISRRRGVA